MIIKQEVVQKKLQCFSEINIVNKHTSTSTRYKKGIIKRQIQYVHHTEEQDTYFSAFNSNS